MQLSMQLQIGFDDKIDGNGWHFSVLLFRMHGSQRARTPARVLTLAAPVHASLGK